MTIRLRPQRSAEPAEELDLAQDVGARNEAKMHIRNDYIIAVVGAALLGLVVVARWWKAPLGKSMPDILHIHDDDLELYQAGRLEQDHLPALEAHLSGCQECRARLQRCLGPQLEALRKFHRGQGHLSLARMPIE